MSRGWFHSPLDAADALVYKMDLMIRRILSSFHPRNQPWITRQSYCHELIVALTYPAALAMIEGGVVGVLARKTFGVGPMLFAAIMSAPMFANLTSFLWARLSRRRRKVRFINVLQVAFLLTVGSIALLPTGGAGPLLLVGLVIVARVLQTGILTVRSTIWRLNYPRPVRARVTGRLAIINSLLMAVAPLAGYAFLDRDPDAFRLIYPASVLIALIGVGAFSRVRLRGERELLRYESDPAARPVPHGAPAPLYEYDPEVPASGFWSILRRDHLFRRYLQWQFVAGLALMIADVIVIHLIVDLTSSLRFAYVTSITLTTALPMLLAVLTLPFWARYFDRVHIVRLRMRLGPLWLLSLLLNWFAVQFGSLPVLVAARIVVGFYRGAGALAWNLGHNDFADRRLVALYMGIHVTLTGVRGAIGPFLAMALYIGWSERALLWLGIEVPAFKGISHHVFLLSAALVVVATAGFYHLDHAIRRGRPSGA